MRKVYDVDSPLTHVNNDKDTLTKTNKKTKTKKGETFQEVSVTNPDGIHQNFAQFVSCFNQIFMCDKCVGGNLLFEYAVKVSIFFC